MPQFRIQRTNTHFFFQNFSNFFFFFFDTKCERHKQQEQECDKNKNKNTNNKTQDASGYQLTHQTQQSHNYNHKGRITIQ